MSISNSLSIVTNGLVFSYDMSSQLSYKGPVMSNILKEITPTSLGGNGINYSAVQGTEAVYIPTLGEVNTKWVSIMNDYNNVYGTGGSGSCCPSLYNYGGGIAVSPSTLYTYAILYKSTSGYTHPNYMYHYEYNGGTYLTEYGLHTTAQRTHLGDNWYWAWNTFTSQATATIFYTYLFHYEYYTHNRIYVPKVLLAAGNWTGVHPKYWPDVNTSRSSTQSIVDIFGGNSITANSLTYNSDGTFTFDGNAGYLQITNASAINSLFSGNATVEICAYRATLPPSGNGEFLFQSSDLNDGFVIAVADNTCRIEQREFGTVNSVVNATTLGFEAAKYNIITVVKSGTTLTIYRQGVQQSTQSCYQNLSTTTGTVDIGRVSWWGPSHWEGSIPHVKIYNRALSAAEVAQNFNAVRSKYLL